MIQVTELNTKHIFFNTCSHLHVSAEGNILFIITHAQSGPVQSEFYTFSPVRSEKYPQPNVTNVMNFVIFIWISLVKQATIKREIFEDYKFVVSWIFTKPQKIYLVCSPIACFNVWFGSFSLKCCCTIMIIENLLHPSQPLSFLVAVVICQEWT